jgi:hypothetical protein
MSVNITIGNQVIAIPSPGDDPNWAQAIDDAFTAIADQLQATSSTFDISPRVQILTSDTNTNLNLTGVIFPSGSVRSFSFGYAVYRTNGVFSIAENGVITGVYDTLGAQWILGRQFTDNRANGDATLYHTFNMSGDQMQLSTVAIGGAYDSVNSKISFSAKTILVSDQ